MTVGQTSFFFVSAPAQCSNCYDWDFSSGLTQASATDQTNLISLTANAPGTQLITVNYINENGCFQCTKSVVIKPTCCSGELLGDIVCNCGHGPSHGALWLAMSSECRNTVSSINWSSNGAGLSFLGGATSGTTTGPPPPMGVGTLVNFEYSCDNQQYVHVTAVINFNNGCPSITLESNITHEFCFDTNQNTGTIIINAYPNPASNEINIQLTSEETIGDISIFFYDVSAGTLLKTVALGNVDATEINKKIDISSLSAKSYKIVAVSQGKMIAEKLIKIERQ